MEIMILVVYVSTAVFITQGSYISYMFRLLNSHLQAYSSQLSHRMLCTHWDPSVILKPNHLQMIWLKYYTDLNTLGSQCVHSIL